MRIVSELRERLGAALHRDRVESEMDAEMRFHIEMQTEANVRAGMLPAEARRQALIAFGAAERYRDEVREARGLGWLEIGARDLRYAVRALSLNRGFAAALIGTLALGIGAATVMFSIIDALLLRPLPYHRPDRLVAVLSADRSGNARPYLAGDDARRWLDESGVFVGGFRHARRNVLLTGSGEPRGITVEGVDPSMADVLGVRPLLGRPLLTEDASPAAPPVVLLDHALWKGTLGGDPGVLGREIEIEHRRHRVIGVMPPRFKFPEYATTEGWIPLASDGTLLGTEVSRMEVLARIGDGSLQTPQARADAFSRRLARDQPREEGWAVKLETMGWGRGRGIDVGRTLALLTGAVALLLGIAGVNATALLLVRGWSRSHELAVRIAMGASRGRIVSQLLIESALLTLLSGAAAVVVALAALPAIRGVIPESITFFAPYPIGLELRALGFTFAIAAVLAAAIGLAPALGLSRQRPAGLTPYASATPAAGRLRRALVVGEIGVSALLLVGAGLTTRSLIGMLTADPGFRTGNLAVMTLSLSQASYPTTSASGAFYRALEERIEAIPGVTGVALNSGVPPSTGISFGVQLEAEGSPPLAAQPDLLPFAEVPPDFFPVMGVAMRAGRPFDATDAGQDHAIIDEGLARRLWGSANPIGRRFRSSPEQPWQTVVGVSGDIRMSGPDDRAGGFEILYPVQPEEIPNYSSVAIRTEGDPRPLFRAFQEAVHEIDPAQPVQRVATAGELYGEAVDMPRFLVVLMSSLAVLALLLAAVGTYGVLAFTVARRRRDIAIRTALGASRGAALRKVLGEGIALAAGGVAAGILLALALSRVIQGSLYGVRPADPLTLWTVASVTFITATLASYLPARRAARIDPMEVLRGD